LFFLAYRIVWQIVYWRRTRSVKVGGET